MFVHGLQGLLKDQLELVKVQVEGRTRYSVKPIPEQLSFDKVSLRWHRALLLPPPNGRFKGVASMASATAAAI